MKLSKSVENSNNIFAVLFQNETNNIYIQLFRYGIVGGISFLGDFGSLYALTEFVGIPYLISACIGFCVGLVINYLLSIIWVFNNKDSDSKRNRGSEFIGWTIIGVAGLGLNALIMWFFTDVLSVYYLGSKIISTILVFIWNFSARRFLISKI